MEATEGSVDLRIPPKPYDRLKRLLDIAFAVLFLVLLSPLLLLLCAGLYVIRRGKVFERWPKVGRHCETYHETSFTMPESVLRRLPVLFTILKGDMTFIGVRDARPDELTEAEFAARMHHDVRPGLVSLFWLRRRANIAFENAYEADMEYVHNYSLLRDIAIVVRAFPAIIVKIFEGRAADRLTKAPREFRAFGIDIHNLTMNEAIERLMGYLDEDAPRQVCFVNAACINTAYHDPDYTRVLQQADLVLADGIGIKIAGTLLRTPIRQNVNGTDLFPRLCHAIRGTGKRIFLLGAAPGVALAVKAWIEKFRPGVAVAGVRDGFFTPEQEPEVIREINASGAEILLVAFGVPRQDVWIHQHLQDLEVKVAMGVGGLFDFYSGLRPRAPYWMRELSLEWLYRWWQEPGRMWRRYFVGNPVFLFRVLRERFSGPHPPAQ